MEFIVVALGGAIGAMGRYAISLIPVKTTFPVLTLLTNALGAILIGVIVGVVNQHENASPKTILFLKTGICGGFTTFSTFSLEAVSLLERKDYLGGSAYILLSVFCCLIGILIGRRLSALIM